MILFIYKQRLCYKRFIYDFQNQIHGNESYLIMSTHLKLVLSRFDWKLSTRHRTFVLWIILIISERDEKSDSI